MNEEQEPKKRRQGGMAPRSQRTGASEKTRTRPSEDRARAPVEFFSFPRNGKPARHEIPPEVLEKARKQRGRRPLIRFRFVSIRDGECGLELPDYPEVPPLWVSLEPDAIGHREEG